MPKRARYTFCAIYALLGFLVTVVTASYNDTAPRNLLRALHSTQAQHGEQQRHPYVAACVLAKNEHRYIREWIEYHLWIGLEKFYVWDHQSVPSLASVLEDHVLSGVVELMYFSDSWKLDEKLFRGMYNTSQRQFLSPQGWAYDNCFR